MAGGPDWLKLDFGTVLLGTVPPRAVNNSTEHVYLSLVSLSWRMAVQGPIPWLSVHPCRGLVDEKLSVLVQHAAPGQQLTVHALLRSEDGDDWEAFGHYVSDSAGAVDGRMNT